MICCRCRFCYEFVVVAAGTVKNRKMIGFTQYSLQPQSHLDFKWTKLDLQVQVLRSSIVFVLIYIIYINVY